MTEFFLALFFINTSIKKTTKISAGIRYGKRSILVKNNRIIDVESLPIYFTLITNSDYQAVNQIKYDIIIT